VTVEITIGPDGVPKSAIAVSGPPLLHDHATKYALGWRFAPAVVDDQPVAAKFKINLGFSF
jgi:outer membrane biosynthesis protein TonB